MWRTCSGELNGSRASRPPKPLLLRGELDVVPGREALELRPADPAGGERALVAAGLQLGGGQRHFGPGLRRLLRVEAGGLEGVLVVVEDGGGAVEREAQHLAVRRGVVAGHRRHVAARVELLAGVLHHLADRHDRALGGHHGRGADFEHLQDVRRVAGAEGGDRGRSSIRRSCPCRSGTTLYSFWLALKSLARSLTHSPRRRSWNATTGFRSGPGRAGRKREREGRGGKLEFHEISWIGTNV